MKNIALPALYLPISPVEKTPFVGANPGKAVQAEMQARSVPWRVVYGGLALLVEARHGDAEAVAEFERWLIDNHYPFETVE